MVEAHYHNGIDSPQIDPLDLKGFPVLNSIPSYKAVDGAVTFAQTGGQSYFYAMLNRIWTRMATASIWLSNTATLNFGAIGPNLSADLTMSLTGALNTDTISLGVDDNVISGGVNCTNISFFAWVSAPDVVTIRCTNHDLVNTADPASGDFKVVTNQF